MFIPKRLHPGSELTLLASLAYSLGCTFGYLAEWFNKYPCVETAVGWVQTNHYQRLHAALSARAQMGMLDKAVKLYGMMKAQGVPPTLPTFNALVSLLCESKLLAFQCFASRQIIVA